MDPGDLTMSKTLTWAAAPRRCLPVLRLAARLLRLAARALDRWARAPAPDDRATLFEFHAEAGAPEGALYVNGRFVGRLPGVTRL
jgi:hypothetical protein